MRYTDRRCSLTMSRLTRCFIIGFVLLLATQVSLADNLALNKPAIQMSTESPASNAVDGDVNTMSCTTDNSGRPWWAVDLRQRYYIGRVTITFPNVGGDYASGLTNFAVGMPSGLPAVGSLVDTNSYTVCGTRSGGILSAGMDTIDCAYSTQKFRYVIVQSLIRSAIKLCLAEVDVNSTRVTTSTTTTRTTTTTTTTTPSTTTWTTTTFRTTTTSPLPSSAPAAPRKLHITPRESIYQPGDRIECSAEGNPEPSYWWTDLVSGTVIQGAVLVITEEMVNQSHAFKCVATNYYNGTMRENSTTVIFSVAGEHTSSTAFVSNDAYKSATIALAVIAGIAIVIIVLLVLYIVRRIVPNNASKHHRQPDRQCGHSAAATETTTNPRSGDAYEELNMTSRTEPVYNQLER